ncbi:MAG: hypothetical protein PHR19_06330 [Bacteroidales bacterium]|nr:hypothetical protein [Bacteroidales bacterium]
MNDDDIFEEEITEDPTDQSLLNPLTLDEDEINTIFSRNFLINPLLWTDIGEINRHLSTANMEEIKYVRDDLTNYDEEVNNLPEDKGGLYFFYIKHPILPGAIDYLMYIGQVQKTASRNLKVRCREYFYDFNNANKQDKRTRKVRKMIKRWGKYLYLRYIKLDDNDLINSLESLLINNIRPPFNSTIPNKIYHAPAPAEGLN